MKLTKREVEILEEELQDKKNGLQGVYNHVAVKYGSKKAQKVIEPAMEKIKLFARILNESEKEE